MKDTLEKGRKKEDSLQSKSAGQGMPQAEYAPDYGTYHFSLRELALYVIQDITLLTAVAFIFYRSFYAFLLLCPMTAVLLRRKKKRLIQTRLAALNLQFKEAIMAVSASLATGCSVEKAFLDSLKDMRLLYGKDALIVKEWVLIARGLSMNITLEKLLNSLAARSGLEDIESFAEVFSVAKRTGGNLSAIIRKTAQNIHEKVEVGKEIETIISAKRLEQKIMNVIPFLIVLYVGSSNPEFLSTMYHNVPGILIMSICLAVYAAAYRMAERIVDIQV